MIRAHIRPNTSWFSIDWKEIVEYRDLLWLLVLRDLTVIYKQSILGPIWFVLQPLATTVVFTVIFGSIAKIGTDGLPPFIFYMSGTVLWNYFQGVMNGVSGALIGNAGVFSKVYFPRLVVPFSLVVSNLGQFALNFVMFAGFIFTTIILQQQRSIPRFGLACCPCW
jgi:lipopolysaccharide transport system permease protein